MVHPLAGGALVTGDGALEEVEGSSDAVVPGRGLGGAGVLSDGTEVAEDCPGAVGVGAGRAGGAG